MRRMANQRDDLRGHGGGWRPAELALACGIALVLASMLLPMADASRRHAHMAEANFNLDRIARGAKVYYETPQKTFQDGKWQQLSCQLPEKIGTTPSGVSCCIDSNDSDNDERCDAKPGAWMAPTWKALGFALKDQHYYQYSFCTAGLCGGKNIPKGTFVAEAMGDFDCDLEHAYIRLGGAGVVAKDGSCTMKMNKFIERINPKE